MQGADIRAGHPLGGRRDQLRRAPAQLRTAGRAITDRSQGLHAEIEAAGLPFLHRFVELALAFHHAVRGEDQDLAAT
ncbi:hypothetical protein AB0F11_13980 [Streptomyces sp. NPDC032472]|uniref:hypothetical protein n=1 Tax=Streptomyces sp. NPDC032472 TaxID=3155018 RepID=UPI0033F1FD94